MSGGSSAVRRDSAHPHSSPKALPQNHHHHQPPAAITAKKSLQFPSYEDFTRDELPPKIRTLCETIASTPTSDLPTALGRLQLFVTAEDAVAVLRLSYSYPVSALKFLRWVQLRARLSQLAWNLLIDILGKNLLFDAMWDAVKAMKNESPSNGLVSLPTFASIFGSYVLAERVDEAIMSFNVMDKYGAPKDTAAMNSLLSAICKDGEVTRAAQFFESIREKIPPDGDTYAILLEGYERDGNAESARDVFGELVTGIGWSPGNTSAYDAFLMTLVKALAVDEAINFLHVLKTKNCLPSVKFYRNALDALAEQKNVTDGTTIWNRVMDDGIVPNLHMYNSIIRLLCSDNRVVSAYKMLDEMVFVGAFPNSRTYDYIFGSLIKTKETKEAQKFFVEMKKNECHPDDLLCSSAITMFFDQGDPETGMEIWRYMWENRLYPLDECANALLIGFRDLGRLSEVRYYAEDMLDQGVRLHSSTMEKLKGAFLKDREEDSYESILRRWKRT